MIGGKKVRRLFSRIKNYDDDEIKSIDDIKELFKENTILIPSLYKKKKKIGLLQIYSFQNHFESRILRFLYANDFNIEQTYEVVLKNTLKTITIRF